MGRENEHLFSSVDLPTGASEEQRNKYMVLPGQTLQLLALERLEGWVEGGCPIQPHGNVPDQTAFGGF